MRNTRRFYFGYQATIEKFPVLENAPPENIMKILPWFPIMFSLGLLTGVITRAEEGSNTDLIEIYELFTMMEKVDTQTSPKATATPLRGSGRSLSVPFIEVSAAITEKSAIKHMPPTLIQVDGRLNDALWKKAAASDNFWCSLEDKPPTDPTEVWVARDENYLYFGFKAYDGQPEAIVATKTVRDTGLGYDDAVTVQLDTFFNRRDISIFSINPLGTQTDQIAGGRSSKIEWKGDWLGAASRTDYGWSAEFAIPFALLNYQSDDTVFGLNFNRYQNRTKEYSWWADVTPKNLPEHMGQLNGLELPASADRKAWTFMPYVLVGKDIPDKKGNIENYLVTGGIDMRYQPRPDLTGMISLNPDFSQVERAFTSISFSYNEKAVADNRPFFVEGKSYISNSDEYFYSNRAADFDYGGKGFGRVGNSKFGILATSAPYDRYDFAGNVLYELDDTHSAAATITATDQMDLDNILAVGQFDGRQDSGLEYALDAAMTDTGGVDASDPTEGQGHHFKGSLLQQWDYWNIGGSVDQYDVNYFPALGLLNGDLPGTRAGSASAGYSREQSGHFWRTVNGYAGYLYRETEDGRLQNRKWYTGGSVELDRQIRTSFYVEEGPYRPTTGTRGEFQDFTYQDRYYSLAVEFNTRSSLYSFGSAYDWGKLGGGDYEYASVFAWWRPVSELYLKGSYEFTDSFGISKQAILNGTWEITPENSLGTRYIRQESDDVVYEYYRLAYGRKVREGLDIYMVYDKDPFRAEQYSLKLVYAF